VDTAGCRYSNKPVSIGPRAFFWSLDWIVCLHAALHLVCSWLLTLSARLVQVFTFCSTSELLVYCFSGLCDCCPGRALSVSHTSTHHITCPFVHAFHTHTPYRFITEDSVKVTHIRRCRTPVFLLFSVFVQPLEQGAPSHISFSSGCILWILPIWHS
jgi:hypothetical protein